MGPDAVHPNPNLASRLQKIYSLHRKEMDIRLGNTPYEELLSRLGNPHLNLPPTIHIAGTNGKGSTLAFIRAALKAASKTSHSYTSPHLFIFNERLQLANHPIDDDTLLSLIDEVMSHTEGLEVTFFEFTTAMGFLAFSRHPADYLLLETGMGGRLDCTNVIPNPILTAITRISLDHTEFLGTTLPQIAAEKAGIFKQNTPAFIGVQNNMDAVLPTFENLAAQKNVRLHLPTRDYPLQSPARPNLAGLHQYENAALAAAILRYLNIPTDAIATGIQTAHWPARLERLTTTPLLSHVPQGCEIWFDGAHNDSAAQVLGAQLKIWRETHPIHLICGLSANKDAPTFFNHLNGSYDSLTLIDLPRAQKPQTAAQLLIASNLPSDTPTAHTVQDALKSLPLTPSSRVIITGSLYLYQTLL